MKSKIDSIYIQKEDDRICQGDILRDYEYLEGVSIKEDEIKIEKRLIPYLIVLTQDCDLENDYDNHTNGNNDNDKFLFSILVCPGYTAIDLKDGLHLEKLKLKMQHIDSKRWKIVQNNQNPRYHFLKGELIYQIPNIVIDFKHYYTIPRDDLYKNYKNHCIGSINELFRESLSQRFAYYLSRVGLPLIDKIME